MFSCINKFPPYVKYRKLKLNFITKLQNLEFPAATLELETAPFGASAPHLGSSALKVK